MYPITLVYINVLQRFAVFAFDQRRCPCAGLHLAICLALYVLATSDRIRYKLFLNTALYVFGNIGSTKKFVVVFNILDALDFFE